MNEQVLKGRNIIILISCLLIGITLSSILLSYDRIHNAIVNGRGLGDLLVLVFRVGLITSLCYGLFKAYNWARLLLAVIVLISAVVNILGIVFILKNPLVGILSFVYVAINGISGIMLLTSKSIKEYITYKEVQRKLSA